MEYRQASGQKDWLWDKLSVKPKLCHVLAVILVKVYNLSKTWFPHLINGDNSTHLIGLLGGLSEIVSVKCLAQCLAHSVQKMVAIIICRGGVIPPITQDSYEG